MPTDLLTRFSYPKQPGDTPWSIIDVIGPASYVQVVEGDPGPPMVPATGGQVVLPADFALQSFHIILALGSTFASYMVVVVPFLVVDKSIPGGDAFQRATLLWIDLGTMEQATAGDDLSGFTVRLLAIGN